jgi:hypothetical protein
VGLTVLTGITGVIILLGIVELLRRRQLREKYGMLWIAVALVIVPMAFYPRLLDNVSLAIGVANGVSLVLFLGIVFLLLVSLHLSWEVSRMEEQNRTLAEEIALIRMKIEDEHDHG